RDAPAQEIDVVVVETHAAVRDRLSEEPRPRSPVDADDPAAGPVRELGVGARLEGVVAEDRPVRVDARIELVRHVEETEGRLRPRLADGDLPRADELVPIPELEPPRA